MTPDRQAALMFVVNTLVLFGTLGLLHWGYKHPPKTPPLFAVLESVVIVALFFTRFAEFTGAFFALFGLADYRPGPLMRQWISRRNTDSIWGLKIIVYAGTALTFIAMWDLVANTGGGVESPFAPFLPAAAVLGPLLVMQRRALVFLVAAAVGFVLYATIAAGPRPHVPPPKLDHPFWWTYAAVTLSLVVFAGLIAWARMKPTVESHNLERIVNYLVARRRARLAHDTSAETD
jgi:hypothetical protein